MVDPHYSATYVGDQLIETTFSTPLGEVWAKQAWEKEARRDSSLNMQRVMREMKEETERLNEIRQLEAETRMTVRESVRLKREYKKNKEKYVGELAKIIDEMEEERERARDVLFRSVRIIIGVALVYGGLVGVY